MRRSWRAGKRFVTSVLVAGTTALAAVAINAAPAAASTLSDADCQAARQQLQTEIEVLQGKVSAAVELLDELDSLQNTFSSFHLENARTLVEQGIQRDQRDIRNRRAQLRSLHCQSSSSPSS
jgi:hypothetical protein